VSPARMSVVCLQYSVIDVKPEHTLEWPRATFETYVSIERRQRLNDVATDTAARPRRVSRTSIRSALKMALLPGQVS